jgi:hypothetical protein
MFTFENLFSFLLSKVFGSGEIIGAKSGKFKHWGFTAVSAVTLTLAIGPALAANVAEFTTVTNDAGEPLYEYESS